MKTMLVLILLFNMAVAHAAQPTVYVVETHSGFTNTIDRVKQAVVNHNFRVVRERDLSIEGVRVHAIWFCNFEMLNNAIHTQKKVGYLLPFRVTVVEHGNRITVSAENPDKSMNLVKAQFGTICKNIAAAYKAILDEVSI